MAPASFTAWFQQSVTPKFQCSHSVTCRVPHSFMWLLVAVVGSAMASRKLMSDSATDLSSLVLVAIANTFALSSSVYIAANVSGGHVNPAVTLGLAVCGHISVPTALFYWVSQMLASVMACLLLKVDVALDLSHTQNIGRMIKAHFPHSQV